MHTHTLASFNQRKFKIVVCTVTFIFLLLALAQGASAQATADGTTPLGIAPGAPAGSYSLSGFDNVNLFNGNLNFRLPLLSIKGRGSAGYQITLPIERKWIVETEYLDIPGTTDQYRYYPTDDWWTGLKPGYGPGVLQARHGGSGRYRCGSSLSAFYYVYTKTLTRLTFTASDGTEYDLRDEGTNGQPRTRTTGCATSQFNRGRVFTTSDGSSATFVSDTDITDRAHLEGSQPVTTVTGYLLLRDGTRYRITAGKVSWMRDRNGNKTSFTYDSNGRMATVTDSLNRQVTVVYATQIPGADQIIYSGFGGATRTLLINYDYLQSSLRADQTLKTDKQLFPELDGSNYTNYNPVVVKSVTLPNNGANIKEYVFKYNSYGELARVVLPTGGAFEYDYAAGRTDGPASGMVSGGHLRKGVYRRVVERRVYKDGATLESKMTYSRPETTTTDSGFVQLDQYDSGGVLQARAKHYFYGSAAPTLYKEATDYPSWKTGHEYLTEMFGADGATLLRRVNQTFVQRAAVSWWTGLADAAPSNDPRVTEVLTTIEPATANLVTKQTFGYSQDSHNNQTDIYEYDYGAGAPPAYAKRHTQTDFLGVNPVNGVSYAAPSNGVAYNYNDVHLRSLPKETRIYSVNATNGGEALMSRVRYDYDQTALGVCPGIVGQCVAYDAAGQCSAADPATYTTRGNNTGITRYADAASEASAVIAQVGYDVAGNAVSATDALNRVMQLNYADSFADGVARNTYAFQTGTTSPIPDASGVRASSTSLTTSRTYDYWSGLVNSATDANGHLTYLRYYDDSGNYDPLDRLRRVDYPDGGWVKYSYNRNQYGDYVNTSSAINPTQSTDSYQYFDGLGRAARTFAWEGSQWSTTDTQYDALGRVWRVSNPYFSSGAATAVNPSGRWTTTTYDALGRVGAVAKPDGATVSSSYYGNQVTVTDAQSKVKRTVSDALGHLKQVVEDPFGAAFVTNYDYDALGNLRKVEQSGQQRFFMYDSLSRLVRIKNPEQSVNTNLNTGADPVSGNYQWSTAFDYYADGSVWHRTDARGVTTTYQYDNLSRVKQVNYSDGTPYTLFTYDFATNGRGRYYADYESSTQGTINCVSAYDVMGRATGRLTTFYVLGAGWTPDYTMSRSYDLAGNVTSQTYPSGRTVNQTQFDAAGRVRSLSGNLGDGTTRTYAAGITYDEAGRLREEQFGTATPLYHKLHYNVRGQLYDVRLSTVAWANGEWDWNRGAVLNHYSQNDINAATSAARFNSGPENNGNIRRGDSYIPLDTNGAYNGDNVTGAYFATQATYNYDGLNRLSSVSEQNYNSSVGWGAPLSQGYTYDPWGNRRINAATGGAGGTQFEVENATNRLYSPGDLVLPDTSRRMRYDAAGNLIWDAYTSSGSRTYDAENRMKSVYGAAGQQSNYIYDAVGKRMRRLMPYGQESWQIYGFGGELVAEYRASAGGTSPQKEYVYRHGEMLATVQSSDQQQLIDFVRAFYQATLNRQPTETELTQQTAALTAAAYQSSTAFFNTASSMAQSLFLSTAYANRGRSDHQFVYDLYVAFLGREPDTGGWAAWESAVQSQGRTNILNAFSSAGNGEWYNRVMARVGLVNWLVPDHLGTPRIVADKTGTLAGVKRHDYLPFGESLSAGGRNSIPGYAGDGVRQQFTSYEHDTETNLDYAQARYYDSAHGRFTGVDPLASSATPADPQTWNRYSYGANNPLSNTDPTGMFIVMKSPFDGMSPNETAGQAAQSTPHIPPTPPPPQAPPPPTSPNGQLDPASGNIVDSLIASGATDSAASASSGSTVDPQTATAAPQQQQQGTPVPASATDDYNCMAWGLGYNDRWVQPNGNGVVALRSSGAVDVTVTANPVTPSTLPGLYGATWIRASDSCPAGTNKIKIYEDSANGNNWHVQRKDQGSNTWTSKNGASSLYTNIRNPDKFYRQQYHPTGNVKITAWCVPRR
jgi:RHS repeat-associated protein